MPASYPTSIKSFTTLVDNVDDVLAAHQNEPNDEITAIETVLGVNPTTIDDTVAPSSSPASVAVFFDMLANIVKTQSGSTTWVNAAAAAIMKSIGTAKGDIIAFSGSATPVRLASSTTDGDVITRGSTETTGMLWAPVPFGVRTKYIITPSVAANDLTLAIKYIDGNDPTTTNKLTFRIGNTEYSLTTSASFTKNDGTNWCNAGASELAAQNIDFFVYAIGETGASAGLKFGFSRIPYARTMADFVNTTTSEKYIAGNWTNFNATDSVTNIGRFRAQLSATAAFNWSIPSALVINVPIFETDWLTWAPTVVGYSANPTSTVYRYKVISENVKIAIREGANGTSNATSLTLTAPFTALTLSNAAWIGQAAGVDNGASLTAMSRLSITSASASIVANPNADGASVWTNANGKRLPIANMEFPIG